MRSTLLSALVIVVGVGALAAAAAPPDPRIAVNPGFSDGYPPASAGAALLPRESVGQGRQGDRRLHRVGHALDRAGAHRLHRVPCQRRRCRDAARHAGVHRGHADAGRRQHVLHHARLQRQHDVRDDQLAAAGEALRDGAFQRSGALTATSAWLWATDALPARVIPTAEPSFTRSGPTREPARRVRRRAIRSAAPRRLLAAPRRGSLREVQATVLYMDH